MSDVVERLRRWSVFGYGVEASSTMKEAATEIEHQKTVVANAAKLLSEQTAEIERLRAALRKIASNSQQRSNCFCGACVQARAARAALEDKP